MDNPQIMKNAQQRYNETLRECGRSKNMVKLQPTRDHEEKFIHDVRNMTTGWLLNGCDNQEDALREIQEMCDDRLYTLVGMPG